MLFGFFCKKQLGVFLLVGCPGDKSDLGQYSCDSEGGSGWNCPLVNPEPDPTQHYQ